MKRNKFTIGFTLVELVVVIVVLGILATIVTVSLVRQQAAARNAERSSDVTVISEALEKYYDTHGEYPSCSTMTGSADALSGTLKVNKDVLKSPRGTADNSVICAALSANGTEDQFAYVGDGSASCQSGGACLGWEIQYRDDETGEIKSIKSRRTASLATSGQVNLVATTVSDSQIDLSWTAVPNSTSYKVERARNAAMTSSLVTSNTTSLSGSHQSLLAGARYYFRVTPILAGQTGTPGDANAATTIGAPTGTFTASTSLQSSNTVARGSITALTCPAGSTISYAIGYQERNTNTTVNIAFPGWSSSTTRDITASQGYNYSFQAKARCQGPDVSSGEVLSTTSNITRPINSPAAPVYTGDPTMLAGYRYLHTFNTSCPAGTQLSGTVKLYHTGFSGGSRTPSSGYWTVPNTDWWYLGFATGQVWEDVYYYALYQCATDFTTSPDSAQSSTYITVECEPARRNYSASPRCDNYGQSPSSLPWGP